MKHVLLFSHSVFSPTGTAQSSQDMLNGLLSNNCFVTFVTLEAKNFNLIYCLNSTNVKRFRWITFFKSVNSLRSKRSFFLSLWFKMKVHLMQRRTKKLIAEKNWDLVIVNGMGSLFMYDQFQFLSDSKKMICFRESPEIFNYSVHHTAEWLNSKMKEFNFYLFVSDIVKQKWVRQYGLNVSKSFIIENTIREDIVNDVIKKDIELVKKELSLPADKILIICNASIQFHKGQDILLNVFIKLNKEFDNLHLLILGSFSAGGEFIEKIANRIKVIPNVTYISSVPMEQALRYVYACEILTLPSRTEAMPRAILEAMALKKVVIASDVGGIPDLIESGKNGILFRTEDELDFLSKFSYILENKEKRKNFSIAAHKDFQLKYSRCIQEGKWEKLLNSF